MFRSATLKLTLWYLAIVMAISILFSIALYNVTTHELNKGLQSQTAEIYNQFPIFHDNPKYDLVPDTYYDSGVHRILIRLLLFNLIVLVCAGFASYFLAKETLEPIEVALEQQKRFTSDVSHELRTPLTAIKMEGEVSLLNNKASPKQLRDIIRSNLEEVEKLEKLINNLLRLTRLETDELKQNFKTISSLDTVNQANHQVSKNSKNKTNINKDEVKDFSFYGDKDSLVQLLVILIDNALKYSPKNSQVVIESYENKNNVYFKIKDEGKGIESSALEHVFDRFYRAESSRNKQNYDGLGLGLSIAKMIADVHNGTITLISKVNNGTTAILQLPKKFE